MNVSTKQAFSILEDWKNKKSALFITGPIATLGATGVQTGIPKFRARVLRVDPSSEGVVVTAEPSGKEVSFDFRGASFAIAPNMADPKGASFAITARFEEGGMVFFVEDFSRDTESAPLPS